MYNPPRGDNVLLYVTSGHSPPDELILHVSTEPLNQSDVNAYLGAMWAESEAVQYQAIDCDIEFEALEVETEVTLPHAIGDARFKPMRVECEPHQVFLLDCDLSFEPLRAETTQSYGSTAIGNAVMGTLWAECDFCIDGLAVLSPLYADTTTSLTVPCSGDCVFDSLFAESSIAESVSISADIAFFALYAESITTLIRSFSSYMDILEFDDRDTFVEPVEEAGELTNILQFSR